MRHLIQLHNYDKNGLPLGANFQLGLSDNCSIHTRNPLILDEVGSRMFLIFAVGKPRTFFLWDSFIIKKVEEADEQEEDKKTLYIASGKGWALNPPQILDGDDFDDFKERCARFVTVRRVDELPYHQKLIELADNFKQAAYSEETLAFCNTLLELIPKDPDAFALHGKVSAAIGELDDAGDSLTIAGRLYEIMGDHERAAECDTEAEACWALLPLEEESDSDEEDDIEPESEEEAIERVYRSIKLRRGQAIFRDSLIAAYKGRCAVTNCNAEDALEAAHIKPYCDQATNNVRNGILLRADIHTLFDLDLLRINPDTMAVSLSDELKDSSYAELEGKKILLPADKQSRPNADFLRERWEQE